MLQTDRWSTICTKHSIGLDSQFFCAVLGGFLLAGKHCPPGGEEDKVNIDHSASAAPRLSENISIS